MASWELQPEDLSRWDALNSCHGSFLDEIRLVCFSGWRANATWCLVVTTRDKVFTVGDVPAWASDREAAGGGGPLEIAELSGRGIVGLACSLEHCLALTDRGVVLSWGDNIHGQLGLGRRESSRVPVEVPGLSQVTSVSCGWYFSLALTQHEVYVWGLSRDGQCGSESVDVCSPRRVELPAGVTPTSIACGWNHAAAVGSDGKVYCWGSNGWGVLRRGNADIDIVLPSAASQLCCAGSSTLALTADGRLWAWGWNDGGMLGVGLTVEEVTTPKQVMGLESVISISSVWSQEYFLARTDAALFVWGDLGGGRIVSRPRAVGSAGEVLANMRTPTMRVRGRSGGPAAGCLDFTSKFNKEELEEITSKYIVQHFNEIGKTISFRSLEDSLVAKLTHLLFDSN